MKIIIFQLIVSILSVQSSVIPYHSGHEITIINAPPPGQTVAIQAPIVPNTIALVPSHPAVVAEIPASKIPAAVSVAESPARNGIPVLVDTVSTNNLPAAVSIAESPATVNVVPSTISVAETHIPNVVTVVQSAAVTESSETDETPETPDPTESTEPTESHDDDSDGSENDQHSGDHSFIVSPGSVIASEHGAVGVTGDTVFSQGTVPAVVAPSHTIIAGSPAVIAHPAPVLIAAEGTYVAKTRGSEHIATLPGHINSASSINLEPAPGTI